MMLVGKNGGHYRLLGVAALSGVLFAGPVFAAGVATEGPSIEQLQVQLQAARAQAEAAKAQLQAAEDAVKAAEERVTATENDIREQTTPEEAAIVGVAPVVEEKKNPWEGTVSLAYLVQNGNTKTKSSQFKTDIGYHWEKWRFGLKADGGSNYSKNKDTSELERVGEKYYVELREDRDLGEHNYFFNQTTYTNDNFSSFAYELSDSFGLGRRFIDTKKHLLALDAGPMYRYRKYRDPEPGERKSDSGAGLHLGLKYEWKISEYARFSENLTDDITFNNGDTLRAETMLSTDINKYFSLGLTHTLVRNSKVAAGDSKTDTQFGVQLSYKIQ